VLTFKVERKTWFELSKCPSSISDHMIKLMTTNKTLADILDTITKFMTPDE
jgi:hypothetical protein